MVFKEINENLTRSNKTLIYRIINVFIQLIISLKFHIYFLPFCLKPFGFSRPGNIFDTFQDGGHRGRKASVANEKIRNTRFGTNRGRLPDFFMQPSRRRSLAVGTARRNFVTKNQRTRKPTDIKKSRCSRTRIPDSKEIVLLQWQ